MVWFDTVILIVIGVLGLFLFYKALKEPLDHIFALIRRGIDALKDKIQSREGRMEEVIRYG